MKEIDLSKTVYQLTEQYPELAGILKEIGFLGAANPLVRKTLGKKMNLMQGSRKQGISLELVIRKLEQKGFKVKPE